MIALALLLISFTARVSFAGTGASAGSAAELEAIVKQLAVSQKQATESCDASSLPAAPMLQNAGSGSSSFGLSGAPTLWVSCAMPYTNGENGADCGGKHLLQYQVHGASANAKVTAELMALDTNGALLKSFLVKNGDAAHLASKLNPGAWKFTTGKKEYSIFAPVPLFRVTVEDQGQKAVAYCSNIPWLDVIEPSGGVVTESEGASETHVLAAAPRTDPNTLHVLVDGDDLLADLGANGQSIAACNKSAPCDGIADINGQPVQYNGLIIDIAPHIGALASNTVSLTLNDLSCGSHKVQITSSKALGLRDNVSAQCNVDDLSDLGTSSVFAIRIDDPTPMKVTSIIPTPVAGQVCSGTEITDLNINGKTLPVAGQVHTTSAGGDVYTLDINTLLDKTDLKRDLIDTHDAALGTFDAGTNRLVAAAKEVGGRRTFKRVLFATGDVLAIGIDANANVFQSTAALAAVNSALKAQVQGNVQQALSGTSAVIENAFVAGISAEGAQTLFNNLCTRPIIDGKNAGQVFKEQVTAAIAGLQIPSLSPDVPCAPDPTVNFTLSNIIVGDQVSCDLDFQDGQFTVKMNLPDVQFDISASGHAQESGLFGECIVGVTVRGTGTIKVEDINLSYAVTEDNLLNNTFSAANFDGGLRTDIAGDLGVDFCGLSEVCDVLVTIFTFGQVDLEDIDFSFVNTVDFSEALNANQPDPVKLNEIKVDETVVANFDQKLEGFLSSVQITPGGISAGLRGEFATLAVDTDVESTPGVTLTPVTTVPAFESLRTQGAKDALIGLSDDSINMMFASLTAAGNLKIGDEQGCVDTGAQVGSILPADCDTLLVGGDNIATAEARGYCEAIKGASCNDLHYITQGATEDLFLTSTLQGACHGASGAICTDVFAGDLVKLAACSITPNFNLKADQGLLLCAKGAVPPRMVFPNTGGVGDSIPTALRLNDFSVSLVIDRTGNNTPDAPLAALPGCFGGNLASDCNVFSACLDLNMNFGMNNLICGDGKPGFKAVFDSIQVVTRDIGVVCSGGTSPTTDSEVLGASSDNTITIPLGQNAGTVSPDICGAGLNLAGIVECATPQIVSIEADGLTEFKDYLGITCAIQ